MSIVSDAYKLDAADPLLVRSDYSSVMNTAAGHVNERRVFWLERSNVHQLAEVLTTFLSEDQSSRMTVARGDDNIVVYESGPDYAPYVNLENRRPKNAARGGMWWAAMSRRLAKRLAAELRNA